MKNYIETHTNEECFIRSEIHYCSFSTDIDLRDHARIVVRALRVLAQATQPLLEQGVHMVAKRRASTSEIILAHVVVRAEPLRIFQGHLSQLQLRI